MIYLIDDKNIRQKDFGWNEKKFSQFSGIIKPLYIIEDIIKIGEDLYLENNIILYHESFLDFTSDKDKALKQREKLTRIAAISARLAVAFFSGSQSARSLNGNIAYLPVSTLYQNLEILVQKHSQGFIELKYLLFGANPEIEEELNQKLIQANRNIEDGAIELPGKTVFFHPDEDYIQNAILDAQTEEIYAEKDFDLAEIVLNLLSEIEYDNIFVPLCFGKTLSDYNGLKLAAHIRCTPTKNQLKRIFIYGFVGLDYLLEHEYFNILKSKNVQLVSYTKNAFGIAANTYFDSFKPEELSKEIRKLKLEPPLNYADSHSIANEWAIYRWALSINASDPDIDKITRKVNSQIYFKYLQTVHPKSEIQLLTDDRLKVNYTGAPKILYIDDEADKGWYEIFCNLLYDRNGLSFEHLDDEFNSKTQDQIIKICIEKIKEDDIDLVILDFRLHPDDFGTKNIGEVTGLKLLKAIKKWNPGIQVIIFTASNKVWNLLELQSCGADGFIFKEGPEDYISSGFTKRTIKLMLSSLEERIESCFLKSFYKRLELLEKELLARINFKKAEKPLPKEFVFESLKWFKLSIDYLKGSLDDSKRAASFLFMFSVLENLSTRVIDVDNPIYEGNYKNGRKIFKYEFRSTHKRLRNYIEDESNTGFYRRTNSVLECSRSIPWNLKILNTLDFITNDQIDEQLLSGIVKKRNDFVHSNTTTGNRFTISNQDIIWLNEKIFNGLMNVI